MEYSSGLQTHIPSIKDFFWQFPAFNPQLRTLHKSQHLKYSNIIHAFRLIYSKSLSSSFTDQHCSKKCFEQPWISLNW